MEVQVTMAVITAHVGLALDLQVLGSLASQPKPSGGRRAVDDLDHPAFSLTEASMPLGLPQAYQEGARRPWMALGGPWMALNRLLLFGPEIDSCSLGP